MTDSLHCSGWYGHLQLVYASDHPSKKTASHHTTQIISSHVQAPLKVQRPFYPEGPEVCHSVILHTAGGVVGGDRLSIDLQLQPHAHVLLTTAAAGKLYRSNGLEATQTIQIGLSEGACLEWLPQETIVFSQAIYRQNMHIDLTPGASWIGWEITRFGRSARGEQFLAGNWRSHTEVWQQGRPLWIDRQWMPGGEESINSPHGLAGYPVVGSLVFVGYNVETELVEKARSLWTNSTGDIGVTRLQTGLLCRYRGPSSTDARRWFIEVWRLIRASFLGRSTCLPRVWNV